MRLKKLSLTPGFALLTVIALWSFGFVSNRTNKMPVSGNSSPGVAVLELFTSEGCSSCPPADRLLPKLANGNSQIIPLSFHVDYWNYLGWTDPFSQAGFSERQRNYVRQFRLESAYTPQLVINGKYELVGSDQAAALAAIQSVLKEPAATQISLSISEHKSDSVVFSVGATGELSGCRLEVMLVRASAVMKIGKGENRGATLEHINIVTELISREKIKPEEKFGFRLPEMGEPVQWKLVLLTRKKSNLSITGALLKNLE